MPILIKAFLRTTCVISLMILMVGCSFTRLGYENLDWFAGWKLRSYVSLDRDQKRWLSAAVREHHQWHCENELPRYRDHLVALRDIALSDQPDYQEMLRMVPAWEQEARRTLERLVPTAAGLLSQLDDAQVQELQANLADKQQELHERYLAPDLAEQHRTRSERARDRLESWLGRLTQDQILRIEEWASDSSDQSRVWLANRERMQGAFSQALTLRKHPEFEFEIRALMLEPERFWTDDYQLHRVQGAERLSAMVADVLRLATTGQREHLARRSAKLIADLDAMRCPAGG